MKTKPRVGLCGFSIAMGRYPFPVVEVQSTFYDPPADSVMQKWPRSLEYTMKVWQLVTHPRTSPTYRRLRKPLGARDRPGFFADTKAVARGWQRSLECAELLGATALLFQCPPSFRPELAHVRQMTRFFERIARPKARLLWEPRGADWIAQRDLALALCRDLNLVHVVDPFVTPPEPRHPVYWRLHGIGGARHSYSAAELRQLKKMLVAAAPRGPAYVLFNNLPRVGDAKRFLTS
ncbi:MAG TPA: DUF72 domain-containing protein [Burkholderiales bacterium]|nr:DUF72 domain-containing protein [Burkholderiales bacterium]